MASKSLPNKEMTQVDKKNTNLSKKNGQRTQAGFREGIKNDIAYSF